jgi:hypothetical protein
MKTGQTYPGPTPASQRHDPLRDVDSAALVLAGLAGAVVLFTRDQDWDLVSSIMGSLIIVVVLAFHRPVQPSHTPRGLLLKFAFGGVLAVGVAVTAAWPLQALITHDCATTLLVISIWPLASLIAWGEERYSKWLDPPIEPPEWSC